MPKGYTDIGKVTPTNGEGGKEINIILMKNKKKLLLILFKNEKRIIKRKEIKLE